jgi:hypothetical protein
MVLEITLMHVHSSYNIGTGIVEIDARIEKKLVAEIKITGDLGANPPDFVQLLEKHLVGVRFKKEAITNAVTTFYLLGARTEKITKEQLIDAIMGMRKV